MNENSIFQADSCVYVALALCFCVFFVLWFQKVLYKAFATLKVKKIRTWLFEDLKEVVFHICNHRKKVKMCTCDLLQPSYTIPRSKLRGFMGYG